MLMKNNKEKISCRGCRHFYITWEQAFPNACRAMGFKSKTMPDLITHEASGMVCQQFVAKKRDNGNKRHDP